MISPITCITLVLAAGSGLYVYQTKHQAQLMDREIGRTLKTADASWQRAGVLRAEYALLNDPSRLADLAGQYVPNLQATAPGQFSTWTDLDKRLPPVGPPPAPPAEEQAPVVAETAPVAPETANPPPPASARAEAPRAEPVPPSAAPPTAGPPPAEPSHVQVAALPKPVQPVPRAAPVRHVAEPAPIGLPVTQVAVRSEPQAPTTAPPMLRPTPVASAPPPMVGSALGMARTMRPPEGGTGR